MGRLDPVDPRSDAPFVNRHRAHHVVGRLAALSTQVPNGAQHEQEAGPSFGRGLVVAAAGIMALGSGSRHCIHAKEMDDAGRAAQMAYARSLLMTAWEDIRHDVDRALAARGQSTPKPSPPPSLSWGPDGGMQAVVLLPEQAHNQEVRSAIVSNLAGNARSRSTQVWTVDHGQVRCGLMQRTSFIADDSDSQI